VIFRRHDDEAIAPATMRLTTVSRSTLATIDLVRPGEGDRSPDNLVRVSTSTKVMLASAEQCVLY
jgi:hypothetical protein